jgi:hypothetical protein
MTTFVRRPKGRNNLRPNGRRPNNGLRNSGSSGQIVSLGEQGNNNSFVRNRNNNNRNSGSVLKLLEKYRTLANDALAAGDIMLAESYFQHADHFVRQLPEQKPVVQVEENEGNSNSDQESNEENNAPVEANDKTPAEPNANAE